MSKELREIYPHTTNRRVTTTVILSDALSTAQGMEGHKLTEVSDAT